MSVLRGVMKTKKIAAVCIILILTAVQSFAFTINGKITDENNNPIPYAFIEAITPEYQMVSYALSDKNGNYKIDNDTYEGKAYAYAQALGYIGEYFYENDNKTNLTDRMGLISSNSQVNFTMKKGFQRVEGVQVIVWNDKLDVNFQVYKGYRDLLENVFLKKPDGTVVTLDLEKGFVDASTQCFKSAKWWDYTFDDNPIQYGRYKFTFVFSDGYSSTYTKYLKKVDNLESVDNSTINLTIDDSGTADISWYAKSNQYYRLKIKGENDNRYYFSIPAWLGLNGIKLSSNDMPCLEVGKNYKWAVSTYDTFPYPPSIVVSPVNKGYQSYIVKQYNPKNLKNRLLWFGVWDFMGKLNLGFNVRQASRKNITKAYVTAPDGAVYTFDLSKDWKDLSTETDTNEEFSTTKNIQPLSGTYILNVEFKDTDNETATYDFEGDTSDITPIDNSSMKAVVDKFNGILFEWKLPDNGENQFYDVRIRSLDNKKEYLRKMVKGQDFLYAAPWELTSLTPSKKYIWLIRIWSSNYSKGWESSTHTFTYESK